MHSLQGVCRLCDIVPRRKTACSVPQVEEGTSLEVSVKTSSNVVIPSGHSLLPQTKLVLLINGTKQLRSQCNLKQCNSAKFVHKTVRFSQLFSYHDIYSGLPQMFLSRSSFGITFIHILSQSCTLNTLMFSSPDCTPDTIQSNT